MKIGLARFLVVAAVLGCMPKPAAAQNEPPKEFKTWAVPNLLEGAEFYFSPDGKSLIGNAKQADDSTHKVYTLRTDGTHILRMNNIGEDACSFYFPNGKKIVFTSTRDNLEMPKGNFSDPFNYPQGAEIYSCNVDGSDVKRLTNNSVYDAEVSVSPDGKKLLFTRQIDGKLDLWTMNADGSDQKQLTHTPDWQEGGSFFIDSKTIICRAWELKNQAVRGMPMSIFTMNADGSNIKRITNDSSTNWAPHPAPDGDHFVFVKVLPPHNYEIFMRSLKTGKETRLTYSDAFDGFPALSPDGKLLTFSSNRDAKKGERKLRQYIMDVSALRLGHKK